MSSHGARLVRGVLVTDFVVIRILVVSSSCSPSSLPSPVVKLKSEKLKANAEDIGARPMRFYFSRAKYSTRSSSEIAVRKLGKTVRFGRSCRLANLNILYFSPLRRSRSSSSYLQILAYGPRERVTKRLDSDHP